MTKKTDVELRERALELAQRNKPSDHSAHTFSQTMPAYDLIGEARKIFIYLKTGK